MRTTLLSLIGLAGLAAPAPAAAEDFTGFYAGVNAGYALDAGDRSRPRPVFPADTPDSEEAKLPPSAASASNAAPYEIMATVMAAGMVPPLAMALSTAVRPRLYTPAERDNGKAAWLLGLSFISEGAIPFAAADPLRVIPSMMLGGATTGAIVAASGVELRAPHGGIFVFFTMNNWLLFLVSLVAGTVLSARPSGEPVGVDVGGRAREFASVSAGSFGDAGYMTVADAEG